MVSAKRFHGHKERLVKPVEVKTLCALHTKSTFEAGKDIGGEKVHSLALFLFFPFSQSVLLITSTNRKLG